MNLYSPAPVFNHANLHSNISDAQKFQCRTKLQEVPFRMDRKMAESDSSEHSEMKTVPTTSKSHLDSPRKAAHRTPRWRTFEQLLEVGDLSISQTRVYDLFEVYYEEIKTHLVEI